MSTDLQKYSTENQLEAIRRYADKRGLEICRIYEDSGRSGLTVGGRDGLQQLMKDVQSSAGEFDAILVYDVSRWGRFQNADEAAYYEHLCSRAGIRVHYCEEQFDNDGSIGSILLKNVKRVMAGEYSRELSVKVFAGQCRLVELGFRQGGAPGYGLRRELIDENHVSKGELQRGDRKSLQTDRVVLTLGPQDEIDQVLRIYSLFVDDGLSEQQIASDLNNHGILTDLAKPWTRSTVHQILTNEKYIGNNVFNRISFKLKQRRIVNNRETWVRAEGVYPSVVSQALFERARSIIDARSNHYSDEQLFASACARASCTVLRTCCGFRFRRRKRIGSRVPRNDGRGCWMRSVGHSGWRANTDATENDIGASAIRCVRPNIESNAGYLRFRTTGAMP